jgi:hypothetical protein
MKTFKWITKYGETFGLCEIVILNNKRHFLTNVTHDRMNP